MRLDEAQTCLVSDNICSSCILSRTARRCSLLAKTTNIVQSLTIIRNGASIRVKFLPQCDLCSRVLFIVKTQLNTILAAPESDLSTHCSIKCRVVIAIVGSYIFDLIYLSLISLVSFNVSRLIYTLRFLINWSASLFSSNSRAYTVLKSDITRL